MTPVYYVLDLTRYYLAEPRSLACDAHVCIRVPDCCIEVGCMDTTAHRLTRLPLMILAKA